MKQILSLLTLLSTIATMQAQYSRVNLSFGTGLPLGYGTNVTDITDANGQVHPVTNLVKTGYPLSLTAKAEVILTPYLAVAATINRFRYRMEYDAEYPNWDLDSTFVHHFVQENGRLNANLRLNFLLDRDVYVLYGGIGAGVLLKEYYADYTVPNMTSWGRDSDPFPLNFELTAGARVFPILKLPYVGFFMEVGLAQSWLQGGLVVRDFIGRPRPFEKKYDVKR